MSIQIYEFITWHYSEEDAVINIFYDYQFVNYFTWADLPHFIQSTQLFNAKNAMNKVQWSKFSCSEFKCNPVAYYTLCLISSSLTVPKF